MEWLLSWEVSSVVVGLFITVALGVLALGDFKIAKVCFCFAAGYAAAGIFMWEAHSKLSSGGQIGVGILALFFVFLLLVAALRYADQKEVTKKQEKRMFSEEFARKMIEELKKLEGAEPLQITEEPQIIPSGAGFVQFEGRSIVIDRQEDVKRISDGYLRVGEIIKVKFTYANRGPRPVLDAQSWGVVVCVDPAKNPGKQLREVMLRGITVGYEQFKGSGNDLGAGMDAFNFAQSVPLTEEDIDGLKTGTLRVHLLLGGAWSDATGRRLYWTNAEWTNWPQVPMDASFWKGA
jgi:hypothetical protein